MTRGRELEAWRVTESVACPIPVSIARVAERQRKRLGMFGVAVCRHCRDGLYVVRRGDPWLHKQTGIRSCRFELARTHEFEAEPAGAHRLEPHPVTKQLHCPVCAAGPYVFTYRGYRGDGTGVTGRLELDDTADLPAWTQAMYKQGHLQLSVYAVGQPDQVAGIDGATAETGRRTWWAEARS